MHNSGAPVARQSVSSPRTTSAAVSSQWVRPRNARSCAQASAKSAGLSNHSSPTARIWSAPMTSASGCRRATTRAFSAASASAQSIAESPRRLASRFSWDSSIAAGLAAKSTPADRSNPARAALAEARMICSAFAAMTPHQQLVDRRRGLLDRAPGDVDDRPMMLGKDPPRLADLGADRLDIGVIGGLIVVEHAEPVAAQMDQPLGIIGQTDDQRFLRVQQFRGKRDARHERHIGGLDATIGEIQRGRRLRCPRHPDQADIGIIDPPARLPIIMIDGKGHRIDAVEIFAVEQVLLAGQPTTLPAEMRRERPDHRIEHGDRGHLKSPAALLQHPAQRVVDHREEYKTMVGLDAGKHAIDLAARSHHAPNVLDRLGFIKLNKAGAGNRMDRIAGRIGNQVKMKPRQRHPSLTSSSARSTLWINRRNAGTTPAFSLPMILIPIPDRSGDTAPASLFSRFYPRSTGILSTRPPYRL